MTIAIQTPRLSVRSYDERDVPQMAAMLIEQYEGRMAAFDAMVRVQENLRAYRNEFGRQSVHFGLFSRHDDRILYGQIIAVLTEHDASWEIGYYSRPAHRKQGYISEGLAALKVVFRDAIHMRSIHATVAHRNPDSSAILERSGFTCYGVDETHKYYRLRVSGSHPHAC